MKLNDIENLTVKAPPQNPCQASDDRDEQYQKDKEFMQAMNEFTAEAGLLSDDPFFEGL
ncbi:hypothetical protein ACN9PN_03755 [Klebsiella pasteurii]|uniref:hypothetical protein n=1 Tax=Klebsiella TaxID=570 RepID=UPI00024FBAAE|nr:MULTISPECIES: hypothetical protein [Klebsiella]EHT13623.1 hypothetical protein HMPREF9694_00617 [Klebsiella michiganensis]MDD9660890.1 hypothetical protein [Klebsiella pasteurii]MDD9666494.1 hypothetical protein [Klebsiella pasteurii]MDD9682564.1 hypothetical protein [Klebsiella pasteurii]MDH0309901.1 hypothetical protein [Klebsiella pasteurii]